MAQKKLGMIMNGRVTQMRGRRAASRPAPGHAVPSI